MKCQLLRLAALRGHYVDVVIAVILRGKGDPLPVGRELREQFLAGVRRDSACDAAIARGEPQVASITENDEVAVDVGELHEPAFRQVDLGYGGGGNQNQESGKKSSENLHALSLRVARAALNYMRSCRN